MTSRVRVLALLAAGLVAASAHAASSLNVVLNVVLSSGPCAASADGDAVSVSCGTYASLPELPPVSGIAGIVGGAAQQALLGGSFGVTTLPFVGGPVGGAPGAGAPGTLRNFFAPPPSDADERAQQEIESNPESPETGEPALRQVGILPAWATGHNAMAVYSAGANLSSWRVVSNDNAQHVELTISW